MYDGYVDGDYAPKGYTEEADAEGGYYDDDDYVYTSWRLGLDHSLFMFMFYQNISCFVSACVALRLQKCFHTLIIYVISLEIF